MSQHHVSYQITPLVTLSHTKMTECNLLYLLLPLHDQTYPKVNTFNGMIYAQVMLHSEVCHTKVHQMFKYIFSDMLISEQITFKN